MKETKEIKLSEIRPFGPVVVSKALLRGIEKNGVLEPIIVVKDQDKYIVIAGQRRVTASKLAGKETIPAIIIDKPESEETAEIQLSENFIRSGNVIKESKAFQILINKEYTHAQIAKMFGISKTKVTRVLSISKVIPEATSLYQQGKMSENTLFLMSELPGEKQKEIVSAAETKRRVTYNSVREKIKQFKNKNVQNVLSSILSIENTPSNNKNTDQIHSELQEIKEKVQNVMKTADKDTTQKLIKVISLIESIENKKETT